MNIKKETWKDVVGYEGIYKVSNLGRVKRLAYKKRIGNGAFQPIKEKILLFSDDTHGYYQLSLSKNLVIKKFKVHRLVALAFIPNPENKKCVNHKNGVSRDNTVENLEWCTYSENNFHMYRTLGWKIKRSTGLKNPKSKPVYSVDQTGKIKKYVSVTDAEKKTGLFSSNICKCLKGEYKTCGGKKWFYDKERIVSKTNKTVYYK